MYRMKILIQLFCIFFLTSCSYAPRSTDYQELYCHLNKPICWQDYEMVESDYFLIILVDARHLDYSDNKSFLGTVAKHPDDGSKNGDIGHAWIYLQGIKNGKKIALEGGHSGERGVLQAKYFDGIMNYNDFGYANPTTEQIKQPCYEKNPIKYLWTTQQDGFFQKGSGNHSPTFAAKIDLTKEQFEKILLYIQKQYPYDQYGLTGYQCSSFVAHVAAIAGFYFEYNMEMPLQKKVWYGGRWVRFWEDEDYSSLVFASPDKVEQSLMEAVEEGRAEYALDWYLNRICPSGL